MNYVPEKKEKNYSSPLCTTLCWYTKFFNMRLQYSIWPYHFANYGQ